MKMSKLFVQTLREFPSDAEVMSHKLLVRAGYIRKLAQGVYNYMPLMWRVLKKVENIVREEMDAAGAQELLMPFVQPVYGVACAGSICCQHFISGIISAGVDSVLCCAGGCRPCQSYLCVACGSLDVCGSSHCANRSCRNRRGKPGPNAVTESL